LPSGLSPLLEWEVAYYRFALRQEQRILPFKPFQRPSSKRAGTNDLLGYGAESAGIAMPISK